MKVRDSGMPDEEMWSAFFDPAKVPGLFVLDLGVRDHYGLLFRKPLQGNR